MIHVGLPSMAMRLPRRFLMILCTFQKGLERFPIRNDFLASGLLRCSLRNQGQVLCSEPCGIDSQQVQQLKPGLFSMTCPQTVNLFDLFLNFFLCFFGAKDLDGSVGGLHQSCCGKETLRSMDPGSPTMAVPIENNLL